MGYDWVRTRSGPPALTDRDVLHCLSVIIKAILVRSSMVLTSNWLTEFFKHHSTQHVETLLSLINGSLRCETLPSHVQKRVAWTRISIQQRCNSFTASAVQILLHDLDLESLSQDAELFLFKLDKQRFARVLLFCFCYNYRTKQIHHCTMLHIYVSNLQWFKLHLYGKLSPLFRFHSFA